MNFSAKNLKTVFTLSILVLALSSCEKDDKLEAPDEVSAARAYSQEFALSNNNLGLSPHLREALPPDGMYQRKVFNETQSITDYYGSSTTHTHDWFNFIEAKGNHVQKRPLIILAPGGGYSSWTEVPKLTEFAKDLAKRGYAVALIRYSVGSGPVSFDKQHVVVQDIRSAVRYFRLNAQKYSINSENIFIGGWSTGATSAISAAYIEDPIEMLEIAEIPIRDGLLASVNNLGFDNTDNPGVNSKVRGVLGMFCYTAQKTFIDAGEPALMMINHEDAQFANGTKIIGTVSIGGGTLYGTDPMNTRAVNQGFVQGEDLNYIRMTGSSPYGGVNEACLSSQHYNDIANFFYTNLKK